jgi:hypothetical protein
MKRIIRDNNQYVTAFISTDQLTQYQYDYFMHLILIHIINIPVQ